MSAEDWGVEGLKLAPQELVSTTISHLSGVGIPAGILGSDVWSRFGALQIDFGRSELVLPATEAPAPTTTHLIQPASPATFPSVPIGGRPAIDAPMFVAVSPSGALAVVRVRFGGHPANDFLVDSGAAVSVVGETPAAADRLRPLAVRSAQVTLCSKIAAPEVSTGPWSLVLDKRASAADGALPPQPVDVTRLYGQAGLVGLLGSDVLSRFGSIVVDYAHARLLLGTG